MESKCNSIYDEYLKFMEVFGFIRFEVVEWKCKYEGVLDENGVSNVLIKRCDKFIDWKIKYENIISE